MNSWTSDDVASSLLKGSFRSIGGFLNKYRGEFEEVDRTELKLEREVVDEDSVIFCRNFGRVRLLSIELVPLALAEDIEGTVNAGVEVVKVGAGMLILPDEIGRDGGTLEDVVSNDGVEAVSLCE